MNRGALGVPLHVTNMGASPGSGRPIVNRYDQLIAAAWPPIVNRDGPTSPSSDTQQLQQHQQHYMVGMVVGTVACQW